MKLTEAIAKTLLVTGEDEVAPLSEVVSNLRHNGSYWTYGNKRVEPAAMEQLVKDRLAGFPGILKDEALSTGFLQEYLHLKATALPAHSIVVRSRNTVGGFMPEAYAQFSNTGIMETLGNMWQDGMLPADVSVHRFHISPDGRNLFLRLVSGEWNLPDYFGGLVVNNQEVGNGMVVKPGVAKVSCFNWVLKENIYRPEDKAAVWATIQSGANLVSTFAKEGIARMAQMGTVKLQNVDVLFDLVAQELKLPENVKSEMYKYWVKSGSGRSVDDVLQSVTWGVQALTDNTGKRQPKWEARENLETNIWAWVNEMMDLHATGVDLDSHIANRELVKKSKVLEAIHQQSNPETYIRSLPADGFAKS